MRNHLLISLLQLCIYQLYSAHIKFKLGAEVAIQGKQGQVLDVSEFTSTQDIDELSVQLSSTSKAMNFKKVISKESYYYGTDDGIGCNLNIVQKNTGKKGRIIVGMIRCDMDPLVYEIRTSDDGDVYTTSMKISEIPPYKHPIENIMNKKIIGKDGQEVFLEKVSNPSHITPSSYKSQTTNEMTIMVVWTAAAECENAGLDSGCTLTTSTYETAVASSELAVQITATAYTLSNINTQLTLVLTYRDDSGYNEAGKELNTILDEITNKDDGFLDEVHTVREQYGADIVALSLSDPDNSFCGLAWLGDRETRTARIDNMFSVNLNTCLNGYTLPHEVGHNFGCSHDRGTANTCTSDDYCFGWRNPDAAFRTIMAYNCVSGQCDGNTGGGCAQIQRFSNPDQTYQGEIIGDVNNDCARVHEENRIRVGNFFPDPNLDCATSGKATLTVEILTDGIPWEVIWNINNVNSNELVMAGGGYGDKDTLHTHTDCVDYGASYSFTITDPLYNNGLCCLFGQGSYTVKVDGVAVATGAEYTDSDTKTFDIAGTGTTSAPVSPTGPPSLFVSNAPSKITTGPSSAPSSESSNAPSRAVDDSSSAPSAKQSGANTGAPVITTSPSSSPSKIAIGVTTSPSNFESILFPTSFPTLILSTDSPTSFSTNSPISFSTNSPTSFSTSPPTSFSTNSPTSFSTSPPTSFSTNPPTSTATPTLVSTSFPTLITSPPPTSVFTLNPTNEQINFNTSPPTNTPTLSKCPSNHVSKCDQYCSGKKNNKNCLNDCNYPVKKNCGGTCPTKHTKQCDEYCTGKKNNKNCLNDCNYPVKKNCGGTCPTKHTKKCDQYCSGKKNNKNCRKNCDFPVKKSCVK